ncbi:YheC/YheD family protein [Metabacillus sp. GX 13764]|uniref:YheC/YheD family endospore coat-associated protein n=1 Tax=Metabacillus kandeliae TaxID=2900151 RepID=UPI001E62EA8C|nr:YheC/YheD family protein [Metabacillus kandeliae]
MSGRLEIYAAEQKQGVIILPPSLAAAVTFIAFGTFMLPCKAVNSGVEDGKIGISQDLIKRMKLPSLGRTKFFCHENILYLGPLVGIFTAGFTESLLRPVGERSLFFAKMLDFNQTEGMYSFVFGAHQILWEKGTVKGLFYDENGWCEKEVPLPNVVYDRLPNRKAENHQALKKVKNRLTKDYGIPWFNPGFFNKWEIHTMLHKIPESAGYLPETYLAPSIDVIEDMLDQYESIYLKPANGSLGLGVFQIFKDKEGFCYSRYRDQNHQNKLRKYPTLAHFFKHSFLHRKLNDYLIQQGINLIKLNDHPVDFRVHTNKDEYGSWKVTAMAAKVAGKGSATTHINNGGAVKTLAELYSEKEKREAAETSLSAAANLLSGLIDENLPGFIGEIGFDFGVDAAGKVWLFEANSKPGRSIFSHPALKDEDLLSRKHYMEYAYFLTKKAILSPEEIIQ